jgi:nitroreductase
LTIFDLLQKRRTIRRFTQAKIPIDVLSSIVDCGRKAPSGMNKQPLEFFLVDKDDLLPKIFEQTRWAGYLPKEDGHPPDGWRPTAYVVVLVNKDISAERLCAHDVGAAVENMILAALEQGVGSCWIASVTRDAVAEILDIPDTHAIDSVLALGYPDEQPIEVPVTDSIKYYKKDGVLHVPKRKFDDIFHHNTF